MFTPKERRIYKFNNGTKTVSRDPAKLLRRLEATRPAHYEQLLESMKSGDPKRYSLAIDTLVPWIEGIFGVYTLSEDGEGLTEEELFGLLSDFMAFVKKKDDATEPLPSNSPSTQESIPSEAASSPTPTTSASGSGA